jgi:hypothetical protein
LRSRFRQSFVVWVTDLTYHWRNEMWWRNGVPHLYLMGLILFHRFEIGEIVSKYERPEKKTPQCLTPAPDVFDQWLGNELKICSVKKPESNRVRSFCDRTTRIIFCFATFSSVFSYSQSRPSQFFQVLDNMEFGSR